MIAIATELTPRDASSVAVSVLRLRRVPAPIQRRGARHIAGKQARTPKPKYHNQDMLRDPRS